MHFEVLSTKYANINHFRWFFWNFVTKFLFFGRFFLSFLVWETILPSKPLITLELLHLSYALLSISGSEWVFLKMQGVLQGPPPLQWVYSIPAFCRGQVKRRDPAVQTLKVLRHGYKNSQNQSFLRQKRAKFAGCLHDKDHINLPCNTIFVVFIWSTT